MSIIYPVHGGSHQQSAANESFAPMSAEQARVWRANNPGISPWWVVLAQFGLGLLASLLAGLFTSKMMVAVSVFYGSMSVVVPAAVFARGLTSRLTSLNPGTAVAGFFFWEMVKIALTVAMLFAAPGLITALSWPALLVGLVVTMKVYWLALVFKRKNVTPPKS